MFTSGIIEQIKYDNSDKEKHNGRENKYIKTFLVWE